VHAAIPDGLPPSRQLRTPACIPRKYDRGCGHFTTRQNIQFNGLRPEDTPDVLTLLAKVGMRAIGTSSNGARNTARDPLAITDKIVDPRPWCERVRHGSTPHPEFAFLPRGFKIAMNGAALDRIEDLRNISLQQLHPHRRVDEQCGRRRNGAMNGFALFFTVVHATPCRAIIRCGTRCIATR
jgi:sulfite reductase beta subunit-like hemoprotein